jgi:hypothetical protein
MKFIRNTKYYTGIVYEFNLPVGHSCPFAKECLVKVNRQTGKFQNDSASFRCYASSAERFPAVRNHRWTNLKGIQHGEIPEIPEKCESVRIHASGDFFSQKYFDMWLDLCRKNPKIEFWAFTKSLPYWIKRLDVIPDNLVLTASYGGSHDYLIEKHTLKHTLVVKTVLEALGFPIDTNDDEARKPNVKKFYLLDNHVKR